MAEPLKAHPVISQVELQRYCETRSRYKDIQRHLRESLEQGAEVEFGVHSAKLVQAATKRPKWKAFVLKKHGKRTVARIIAATKATKYFRMEIT